MPDNSFTDSDIDEEPHLNSYQRFMLKRYDLGEYQHKTYNRRLAGIGSGIQQMKLLGHDISPTEGNAWNKRAIDAGLCYSEGVGTNTYTDFNRDTFIKHLLEESEVTC